MSEWRRYDTHQPLPGWLVLTLVGAFFASSMVIAHFYH